MEGTLGIKELPGEERPRERCLRCGPGALSTVELLAILLRTGSRGTNALEMAREVLSRAGSLRGLAGLAPGEVTALAGLGPARAAQVLSALELARRFAEEEVRLAETLGGAEEAYRFLRPRLRDLPHEVFAAIFLNQKHGVLAYRELFRGSVHGSAVHPREVVKEALKENAAAVILAHNHPSGHVSPSPDDLRLTEELKGVLQRIDVRVIDHLIVGGNGYFSFAREGLLT
jgi:DNA repair protein RadC